MARVNEYFPDKRNIAEHHTEVEVGFSVLEAKSGDKIVNLASFGSKERQDQSGQKVSQTLQFDEAAAQALCSIFADAFKWDAPER